MIPRLGESAITTTYSNTDWPGQQNRYNAFSSRALRLFQLIPDETAVDQRN